ncbi:MAG TPA: amino acid adenylation domain-containing protein, partial [Chitinophagaceae bacterium]|nr:amino acid adenylation domain-containing protein [Chitinophagaceae bacterium]
MMASPVDSDFTNVPSPLYHLFLKAQSVYPGAPAVRAGNECLTYKELNDQVVARSMALISKHPHVEYVGISCTRNLDMIINLLAILRAGKAYLPLDLNLPIARLKQVVSDSNLQICLAVEDERQFFEELGLQIIVSSQDYQQAVVVNSVQSLIGYVLYTSGSTGTPKGVCMGQAALANLLQWQEESSIAKSSTHTLQFAPLTFDVSFQEIFSTLTTGGTLFLIGDDLRLDPYRLLQFINEHKINRLFLPFVALQNLAEVAVANAVFPPSLAEIMTAGEQLKITPHVVRFFSGLNNCVLYNQYGPTEAHVVTQLKLEGDPQLWKPLPSIGTAIKNTEILILDEALKEVEAGVAGELCISGLCLAEGYVNDTDRTKEKFPQWQHPKKGRTKIYRTGDIARKLPGDTIEFLGRKDDQVKIRGYRIEPGEIEVLLNGVEGVQQAIVVAKDTAGDQKKLVAYLVAPEAGRNTLKARTHLEKALPPYMIPSEFIWLDQMPKTASGKIDKKALPEPQHKRPDLPVNYIAPVTDTERSLSIIWSQ